MQSEKIIIEFIKKTEHQKRKVYKFETWFALSNSVLENPDYCDLNPLQFKALIYVYCQCSKNKWLPMSLNYRHAEKLHDIKRDDLDHVLSILLANQKVRVHDTLTTPIGAATVPLQTEKEERETNKQTGIGGAPTPSKNDFKIIDELQGYEPLDEVLSSVSTSLQKQWLSKYKNSEWVKETLSHAVDWHLAKANGEQVTGWPQKLISWLARDKNKPTNGMTADNYDFIPDEESTGVA